VCCPGGSRLEVEGALAATLVHQRDAGHLSGSSCRAPPAASATSSGGGELYAIRVYIVALPFSSAVPYGRSVECGAAGQPAHKGRGL
jgi:hypothetical protein